MTFEKWFDTFVEEKGFDKEQVLTVEGETYGENSIPLGCVFDTIKIASPVEKRIIKDTLVKIDFMNGNCVNYFKHLAQAMAIQG